MLRQPIGELSALKSFVESGGWLVIDDCGGSGKFAGWIESQWLPKLADAKPQPIPDSDPLLADLSPKYREGTTQRLGNSVKPKWLTVGKGKIIYSPIDYTTGLLGANTSGILGYKPASAMGFVKDVLLASAITDGSECHIQTKGRSAGRRSVPFIWFGRNRLVRNRHNLTGS